jgi:hypothetical protein
MNPELLKIRKIIYQCICDLKGIRDFEFTDENIERMSELAKEFMGDQIDMMTPIAMMIWNKACNQTVEIIMNEIKSNPTMATEDVLTMLRGMHYE